VVGDGGGVKMVTTLKINDDEDGVAGRHKGARRR